MCVWVCVCVCVCVCSVLDYLAERPQCVSGTDDRAGLLPRFAAALEQHRPGG